MNRPFLFSLALLGLSSACPALTEDGKKAADELIASLKDEAKALDEANPDHNRGDPAKQFIRQLQSAVAKGNESYIEQILENPGVNFSSEKSIASLAKFKEAIKAGQDQQAQETIDQLEALIQTTTEKILAAKSPAELDELIETLSNRPSSDYDQNRSYNPAKQKTISQLTSRVSYAKQFVIGWQNYLQAKKTDNIAQAIQALQSLSNNESAFIPRSQLLDRIEREKAAADDPSKILDGIKTLDDMQAAIKTLAAAQRVARSSDQSSQLISDLIQAIGRLEKAYREHLAGLPVNIEIFNPSYDSFSQTSGAAIIVQLRADLLKLVLPRYLNLPEEAAAKPGETIPKFIARLLAESKERGDGAASKRIVELEQTLLRSNRFTTTDVTGLQDYSAGQNQIAAGQHFLAVISLQRALSRGSDLLPVGKIGEQLASIKKNHPKEYEEAMNEFLTPRTTRESPFGGMPYRGFHDPRMRYPDGDPRQPSGPTVVLPVPAKEATPPANPVTEKPTQPAPKPAETPSSP